MYLKAAMYVLRYLKSSYDLCLLYKWQPSIVNMVSYSEVDWGSSENDRVLYISYTFVVYSRLVSWSSYNQTIIANLTMELEYMTFSKVS
jgi:hypothetical protein